jgi:type VI secretion system protein ImpH
MAAEGWMENPGVIADALRANPQAFEFFQAVRLLERLRSDRAAVGGFDDPEREVARFGVTSSLAFPAGEIQELKLENDAPARMRVNFMGLTGPLGVLPHPYSLLVLDRLRARDTALADFLDVFHHRFISLFYQAWRKYRFAAAHEDGARDQLREHLLDLIGLGLDGYRGKMPFPDEVLIFRAGLLAPQPRGAVALAQLLEDFFCVDVEVQQFIGGWYPLARMDRCAIGEDDEQANRLGFGAVAGDEIWDQQTRVRIRVGPLGREEYDSFLPGGAGHTEMAALLRFYSHDQFDFELQLVLTADAVPGVMLDGRDDARLGWSTWIRSEPRSRPADETILSIQHAAAS